MTFSFLPLFLAAPHLAPAADSQPWGALAERWLCGDAGRVERPVPNSADGCSCPPGATQKLKGQEMASRHLS